MASAGSLEAAHQPAHEGQHPALSKQQRSDLAHTATTPAASPADLADGIDAVGAFTDGPPNLPIAYLMTMANNHWSLPWLRAAQNARF